MAAKTVVVTGGNKGLGRAIVENLLKTDPHCKVILASRNLNFGNAAAAEIAERGDYGDRLHVQQLDIAREDSIEAFAAEFEAEHGSVDVLVNNAAMKLPTMDFDSCLDTMNTNYNGTKRVTEAMLPHVNKGGHIIVMGSQMGALRFVPSGSKQEKFLSETTTIEELNEMAREYLQSVHDGSFYDKGWPRESYGISKTFVHFWAKLMAQDERLVDHEIRMNVLHPGWIRTDMGGPYAPGTLEEGIQTAMFLINSKTKQTGLFWENESVRDW